MGKIRQNKLFKRLSFTLLSLVLVLAGAEIVFRVLQLEVSSGNGVNFSQLFYSPIDRGTDNKNWDIYITLGIGIYPATPEYYNIEKPLYEKPPGVKRIVCLGDSSTIGDGVKKDRPYPQVLQRVLSQCYPQEKIEVWNLGRHGYSSYQGKLLMDNIWEIAQPDILVFHFGANDNNVAPIRVDKDWYNVPRWSLSAHQFLYRYSHLYRILRNINVHYLRHKVRLIVDKKAEQENVRFRVNSDDFMNIRKAMRRRVAQDGGHQINILYVTRVNDEIIYIPQIQYKTRRPNDVDLYKLFKPELEAGRNPFVDNIHPSEHGHRLIARAIVEKISDLWGPPSCDQEEQFRAERETLRERYSFLPYP